MSLFQNSVLKKYLKSQHTEDLKEKWALFKAYFHNTTIQENIRNSKEEQFQEGFLRELFVNVLGYTLNPEPNFNLTTEYKNVKDSKKADGAIIINNQVKAVIELKGTDTTDLAKVESQAFNYKNNQPECIYVITSNFEKLRFYIDNAIEHLEFNLFNLTAEEFQLLYVCLAYQNIENNVAKQIKDESVSEEDVITKKLYNDYSLFKRELYQNLVQLNPGYDQLELFKKSQKLLDRFLFIFFAEDRSLLPTNLIFRINKEWQQLREMRIPVSLYERYKIYFNDLNHGARVALPAFSQTTSAKKEEYEIYAYNGGLFKEDEILNAVKIDDDILFKHTEKLSNYDFASEVDVNILGHIFENSLNDIDELAKKLEHNESSPSGRQGGATKRKKDGVFYTPKYITKYIVDNTVGKLCADKKIELQLNEEDYITDKKRQKKTILDLSEKLNSYRKWLLQLTICDPACGSGAFLNQALDFLITEHRYIDELNAKLFGDALVLSDVEGSILENNLFGVDINEESVEIAKLSLWLRTAQPNRRLSELSNNIKCGNSLINDINVAGDKAFNWEQEFPKVFQNVKKDKNYVPVAERLARKNPFATKDELGEFKNDSYGLYNEFHEAKGDYDTTTKKHGFDVVIGNPPYGASVSSSEKEFLLKKFTSYKQNFDVYASFMELAFLINKNNGFLGFIVPVSWQSGDAYFDSRNFISENGKLELAIKLPYDVFEGAYVDTGIYIFKKTYDKEYQSLVYEFPIKHKYFGDLVTDIQLKKLPNKYWQDLQSLKIVLNPSYYELLPKVFKGTIPLSEISNSIRGILPSENDISNTEIEGYKKYYTGGLYRYTYNEEFKWVNYGEHLKEKPKDYSFFQGKRILIRRLINRQFQIMATYMEEEFVNKKDLYNLKVTNTDYYTKYVLAVINSKLVSYLKTNGAASASKDDFGQLTLSDIRQIPMKTISQNEQFHFVSKVELIINLKMEIDLNSQKFQRAILRKFNLDILPGKLQDWYLLSYSEFIKELGKKKIKLSLSEEAEWEEYFNTESKKALELKFKIDATDKEIDQMVYKLYDLTDEEIAIVEKS